MSAPQIEEFGDATLILGDSREVLPTVNGDRVVTDPVWPNCPPGADIHGARDPGPLFAAIMSSLPARVVSCVLVMRNDSDPRFLADVPARFPFCQAAWLPYALPSYLGRVLGGNEIAYCFGRHIPSRIGARVVPSIGPKAQPNDRPANGHPMSRALVHFDWLVHWWSLPGETVIDPYMGSGTTGVAALKAGRKFIGIDSDPRWFDLARRRIESELRQGCLLRGSQP